MINYMTIKGNALSTNKVKRNIFTHLHIGSSNNVEEVRTELNIKFHIILYYFNELPAILTSDLLP
jgi:predicted transcriptional regulator